MYGCQTHCIGPGCDFWNICEQLCSQANNICPRCATIETAVAFLDCEQKDLTSKCSVLTSAPEYAKESGA